MPNSTLHRKGSDSPTVPFPSIDDEQPSSLITTPRTTEKKKTPPSHKRSLSGSLFSRLNILRSSQSSIDTEEHDDGNDDDASGGTTSRSTLADATHGKATRKRKGSLRKAVLGRSRDRRGSEKKSPLASPQPTTSDATTNSVSHDTTDDDENTPRVSRSHSMSSKTPSTTSHHQTFISPRWPSFRNLSSLSIPSIRSSIASFEPLSSTTSLLTSPTNPTDSTEDDDPELDIPGRVAAARAHSQRHAARAPSPLRDPTTAPNLTLNDSYFPVYTGTHKPSPLSTSLPNQPNPTLADLLTSATTLAGNEDDEDAEENHSYEPTASLGYLILLLTWLVFTVGMGSSFGIWSWAWDVGETPYAPPELEDDPTLPITGYYPALMVLTAVMAWVWVLCAWVGMKYFRHAAGG